MKDEFKALIGEYEKQPLKWSNKSKDIGYVVGFDPFYPIDPTNEHKSFEDNLVDFFSQELRRAGRTHLLARVFVHLAIQERRPVYIVDHWENVQNSSRKLDDLLGREINQYINKLRDCGVVFTLYNIRDNKLELDVQDYQVYYNARTHLINQQPSFPNRHQTTGSYSKPIITEKDNEEDILLIVNKK